MKEAFEKIRKRIDEITVSRDICGFIVGCNMGECEDGDCLKCLKKKILSIVSEVEAEYKNDVCEWKGFDNSLIKDKVIWTYQTSCKKWCIPEEHTDKHFQFCPYCGKKIKVVE